MKKFLALLVIILSLSSCSNHLIPNDPIVGQWVSNGVDENGCKLVLGFESESYGERWLEKDKKLYGQRVPFIYTRSQTKMTITTLPIDDTQPVVTNYTVNSLTGFTMSLTDIETKIETEFTKK